MAISVGDKAPEFRLPDQNGVERKLSDYRGRNIVIYFYPKDNTPGCTREACELRDDGSEYRKAGIEVLGVSTDSPESHKRFEQKYGLNFTLLADKDKQLSKAFGVLRITGTAKRTTILVDKNGIIKHVFEGVNPKGHSREILAKMKELKMI